MISLLLKIISLSTYDNATISVMGVFNISPIQNSSKYLQYNQLCLTLKLFKWKVINKI
jgi:hypothetical protein